MMMKRTGSGRRRVYLAVGGSIALAVAIGLVSVPLTSPGVERAEASAVPPGSLDRALTQMLAPAPARPTTRSPERRPSAYKAADGQIITPARLRRFLRVWGSPMVPFSEDLVGAGVRYGVDPRVVVAISGVESSFGRHAPGYNAWGWGHLRWQSWPRAIEDYTRRLAAGYRSLRTGRFHRASRTYCPPCGARWGLKAASIFRSI
ncbi:MAG: lytic murein transglycosylase [Acidobacteria bacterium]|nr:lytic murein transglycosylase [Acidobacteriota bacterium]